MLRTLSTKTAGFCLLTFAVIFLASLAISFACERASLPANVKLKQRGRVLQIHCSPDQQPWRAFADGRIEPSRSRSAHYICLYGNHFQQISAAGIENSSFFCADKQGTNCSLISSSITSGIQNISKSLAKWESSNKSISILYCSLGVWYRLGGGILPVEIQNGKSTTEIRQITGAHTLPKYPDSQIKRSLNEPTILKDPPSLVNDRLLQKTIRDVQDPTTRITPTVPLTKTIEKSFSLQATTIECRPSLAKKWIHRGNSLMSANQLAESSEFSVVKDDIIDKVHFGLFKYTMITFCILIAMIGCGIAYGLVQWRRLRKRRECRRRAAEHAKHVLSNVIKIF